MPPQLREEANPANPEEWWNRAKELQLDPRKLDITTYESRSASKFTELDFIHLRAVWSNNGVDRFHINEYVRPEHIKTWDFVLAKQPQTPARSAALPKDWLVEFIHTTSSPFTNDDAKNMRLGAFMTVKSHIEKIRRTNGIQAGGHALKIRRSARIMSQNGDLSALSQQMGSLLINQRTGGATTPPNARRTPSPQASSGSPANIKTHELDVISPETMALEKDRSRDEDTVNMALVSLLDATTICSGIRKLGARQNLSWFLTRQSFQLGLPHKPVCEARTDGVLVLEGNPSRTLAILEVKPYKRTKNQITVEWQEACQMAAWISTSLSPGTPSRKRKEGILTFGDDTKRRRVLISQDYLFLYITIAEWGLGYEQYLYGNRRPPTPPSQGASPSGNRGRTGPPAAATKPSTQNSRTGSQNNSRTNSPAQRRSQQQNAEPTQEELDAGNFLTMNCYGPYDVMDQKHMAIFLRNVLALMMELSDPMDS